MENNNNNGNDFKSNQTENHSEQNKTNLNNDQNQSSGTSENKKIVVNYTTMMASLSYMGPLVLIPFLTNRDKPFVLYHIKQGLVLLSIYLIGSFLFMIIPPLMIVLQITMLVFAIIGILNSLRQQETSLPFVGQFASHIQL